MCCGRGGGEGGGGTGSAACTMHNISFQTDGIHSNDNVRVGNRNPGGSPLLPPPPPPHTHTHRWVSPSPPPPHTHTVSHFPQAPKAGYQSICLHWHISPVLTLETLSEGVKILKAEYLLKATKSLNMDQAIIFCRTKMDCDNMEAFLLSHGGG